MLDPTHASFALSAIIHPQKVDPPEPPSTPTHPWWIPKFCLSPSLRLFLLRVTISSGIVALAVNLSLLRHKDVIPVAKILPWAIPEVVTLTHHIGTGFGPRLFPIPAWADIILTTAEVAWYAYRSIDSAIAWARAAPEYESMELWGPTSDTLLAATIGFSLLAHLVLKLLAVVAHRGPRRFRHRLDVGRIPTDTWWKYPVRSFFGRVMSQPGVPGEAIWIWILRGVLVFVLVLVIVGFAIYKVILVPLSERGTVQRREYWTTDAGMSSDYWEAVANISWHVILIKPLYQGDFMGPGELSQRVTAESTWPLEPPSERPPSCAVTSTTLTGYKFSEYVDVAVVSCPPPFNLSTVWSFPELFITVNFTGLVPPQVTRKPQSSVHVFVGMTPDIDTVVANTEPTYLYQGSNILGLVSMAARQRLMPSPLGFLGLESRKTFMVATMVQTSPNPFAPSPPDLNISTIGLDVQELYGDWRIILDASGDSALAALSAVGGLGSLLSTLLAVFLGTSLMRVVIRAKPDSPFGYIHSMGSVQRKMAAQCENDYPALKDDIRGLEENPGIIAYLFDTLIDVKPLGYGACKAVGPEASPMGDLATTDSYEPVSKEEGILDVDVGDVDAATQAQV